MNMNKFEAKHYRAWGGILEKFLRKIYGDLHMHTAFYSIFNSHKRHYRHPVRHSDEAYIENLMIDAIKQFCTKIRTQS